MTIWDKIYRHYKKSGEEYATLRQGLIPEFEEFINKYTFKKKNVFDIGCGNGKYLAFLKSIGFTTTGIDSSPTAITLTTEALGDNANLAVADMYNYDYPNQVYDLVISIAAIHHGRKAEVRRAIDGVYKSLIPSGRFFITLPDNTGSAHWTMMADHEEIEPGVRVPLIGPEKGLPHSSFTEEEIREMFSLFSSLEMKLLEDRGRWIVSGSK